MNTIRDNKSAWKWEKTKKEHTKRPEDSSKEYNGIAYLGGNSKKHLQLGLVREIPGIKMLAHHDAVQAAVPISGGAVAAAF